MKLAAQFPVETESFLLAGMPLITMLSLRITSKVIAPESKRIMVKLAASMVSSPNARRHNTELAAKAMSAQVVKKMVFRAEISVVSCV